jgi:hypothetical protein
MAEQWKVISPHWTKILKVTDRKDLTQQVFDLVTNDEYPERVEEHSRFWVWVMCQQVGTDTWISLDVHVYSKERMYVGS